MLLSRFEAESICHEIHERVSQEIDLVESRLFGSYARGDADQWSDIDLFMVTREESFALKLRIREIAWEIGLDHGVVVSTLVVSHHELIETPLRSSSIVAVIRREGVAV